MVQAKKVALIAGLSVVTVAVAGIAYLKLAFPKVSPASTEKVESTPELVARGEYLAKHVSVCLDCHAERDWSMYSGPVKPGTEGKGGERFTREMGLPGEYTAPNLTPAHLGDWSDGEIIRAFTVGVRPDGSALFPMMPYQHYAKLSARDRNAIVAYLRTLEPIEAEHPAPVTDFPMSLILPTIPADAPAPPEPDPSDTLAYGEYLANIGGCLECHTPKDHGQPIEGMTLAGGFDFPFPDGTCRSANITPHKTGLGDWTEEQFVARFKNAGETVKPVAGGQPQTVMPWSMYAGMEEQDLRALYAYLQSLEPVDNAVARWEAAG